MRQRFCNQVSSALPKVSESLREALTHLMDTARSARDMQNARDALMVLDRSDRQWMDGVRAALSQRVSARPHTASGNLTVPGRLELLATEAVEDQLLASKLALALEDKVSQEWADLRLRMQHAQKRTELPPSEVVRPEALARVIVEEWLQAGLGRDMWRLLQGHLHETLSGQLHEVYHEANRFLVGNGVMAEIDLRPLVRKAPSSAYASTASDALNRTTGRDPMGTSSARGGPGGGSGGMASGAGGGSGGGSAQGLEIWTRARQQAQDVLGRLRRLLTEQVGDLGNPPNPPALTAHLQTLLQQDGTTFFARDTAPEAFAGQPLSSAHLEQMAQLVRARSTELKKATDSPSEKATIEVVALMFQSILNEDRIPPSLRIWFARLQIPVLRVALAEPDFFSSLQHPARRLIDRMGSCALGFDANLSQVSAQALEQEVRRIVQVIEQYPETGRRVFQLVLDEFQKFLARNLHAQGAVGQLVSVAQQVEQKETLAVQYTIELRKQLDGVPVRHEIRDFLFKVWAEVLAVTTIKLGARHAEMEELRQVASELLWAASAKPSRTERAQVIAQLPGLLARLRKGMTLLGLSTGDQDAQIKVISDILADAFMSKTETIPAAQLAAITRHMSSLEDFLPQDDTGDLELDQESIELITGVDASHIEVITAGGSHPNEAMRAWARELQLGTWFTLDHNGNVSQVQLVWRSDHGQLCLFTSNVQRLYLIQTARVASYLQAGLLAPAEDESLTVRATRAALEKLDANPERLLR
jgi:hypothetical protein